MPMVTPMVRLISFRLSEEEYQEMKRLCTEEGARSLSDFVRSAFQSLIHDNGRLETILELKLRKLEQRLDEIQQDLHDMTELVQQAKRAEEPAPEVKVSAAGA